jgi:hypothetical protein
MMLFDKNMKEEDLYPVISQLSRDNNRVDSEEETDTKENVSEIVQSSEDFEESLKQEDEDVSNMEGVNILGPAQNKRIKAGVVQKHQGDWSRREAENNPKILYVFTDNTDRNSGSGVIPSDSWYSKKYGAGHHFPTMTAAVIRGLDNSRPISTQRWFHPGAKGKAGNWVDADIEEFKSVIRDELQEIVNEFNTGKYDAIMFPGGKGLFNTRISNISKTRTPKLYQALGELLHEFGFDSLIPSDVTINQNNNSNVSSDDSELLISSTDNDNAEALDQTFRLEDLSDALVKESEKPTE